MPGINYTLFTMILVFLLGMRKENVFADKRWLVLAFITLLSGVFVAINGTVTSVLANIVALSMLAVNSLYSKSSFFISIIVAIFSYLSSFVFLILDLVDKKPQEEKSEGINEKKKSKIFVDFSTKLVIGIIGFLVIAIFFTIYRRANPLFKDFTDRINLDFISYPWLIFTFLGFLLMYGYFLIRHNDKTYFLDSGESADLNEELVRNKTNAFLGFVLPVNMEVIIGVALLAVLNILLLMLNSLDLTFMFGGSNLPSGVSYSEYVHNGVGNLIFSVILVIIISMYFFRGMLNFSEKSKWVKILAIIWLFQNLIMLFSTAYRNQLYVAEYSLTYRRIGVFVWLLLTAIGIISTLYKIGWKKSMWYLIRANSWSFFLVIIFLGAFNWDVLIAKYNTRNPNDVDFEYLMTLNNNAKPIVYEALLIAEPSRLFLHEGNYRNSKSDLNEYRYSLEKDMQRFKNHYKIKSWKEWNYADMKTYKAL